MEQGQQANPTKSKIDKVSGEVFTLFLEKQLSEAEVVATVVQALTMRLAYSCKDIEELEAKLQKFPEIFDRYARINLSNAQSAILAKQKELN